MKILQLCNFSSGVSGVWTRVFEDSKEFIKKGHEVHVFSSNEHEDRKMVEESEEILEEIKIRRFPIKRKKGYALWFDFKKEALELKPDVIICHGLRKPYLGPAIKVAKRVGAKIFLITHAPFMEKKMRSHKLNFIISLYDKFLGKKIMDSFDKIITICKWEKENLLKLGCDKMKIEYISNSISDEFFIQKKAEEENKVLYLGRMHQVKGIQVLIEAFKKSNLNKKYTLELVGPRPGGYYEKIKYLAKENITFLKTISDLTKKIEKIDQAKIFVLPSKKEGLPFGLVEAMARGKIVIASRTKGAEELIDDCKNGFLFEIGNSTELQLILNAVEKMSEEGKNKIRGEAIKIAEKFKSSDAAKKWEELFRQ